MLRRARKHFWPKDNTNPFAVLGRWKGRRSHPRKPREGQKEDDSRYVDIPGRLQFDPYLIFSKIEKANYRLRSYTLRYVSTKYLGETKDDIDGEDIPWHWRHSIKTRTKLAAYCIRDCILPPKLITKRKLLVNAVEMVRVARIQMVDYLTRGQTAKVYSKLMKLAHELAYIIPHLSKEEKRELANQSGYVGGAVLEPVKGYHDKIVVVLDFMSLYPTIIMGNNLCITTMITAQQAAQMDPKDYIRTPTGDYFVKAHVRKGLLPIILEQLLAARHRVKKKMAAEKDLLQKALLNGRQLGIKLVMNSFYGYFGFAMSNLPCLALANSVTAYGRQMIDLTKTKVLERYGHLGAEVLYGDTDSVMVYFGTNDPHEAVRLGEEACEYVNQFFPKPVTLEYEQYYYPVIFIKKKRYAGVKHIKPGVVYEDDPITKKGIENVRTDRTVLTAETMDQCLDLMLLQRNPTAAVQYAQSVVSDLYMNRVPMEKLVISKVLSKPPEDYPKPTSHVEVAKKRQQRGDPVSVGDKVPYIILGGGKKTANYLKAEDPVYAKKNDLHPDPEIYIKKLKNPLLGIFGPVIGSKEEAEALIFSGKHTRKRSKKLPKKGGLLNFLTERTTVRSSVQIAPVAAPLQVRGVEDKPKAPRTAKITDFYAKKRPMEQKKHQNKDAARKRAKKN